MSGMGQCMDAHHMVAAAEIVEVCAQRGVRSQGTLKIAGVQAAGSQWAHCVYSVGAQVGTPRVLSGHLAAGM